ncbi:MAG: hypothetical protein Ct9H90mP27_0650 [Gammaproteobacteria bacterium]|nr:MAG: hypothetical protein Ct9H90mP27_0650 [Gammaproteobacteria bacterium]
MASVDVMVKGPGPGRESAVRALKLVWLKDKQHLGCYAYSS